MGLFEVLIANMILICGTNMQSKVKHEFWSYLRFSVFFYIFLYGLVSGINVSVCLSVCLAIYVQ